MQPAIMAGLSHPPVEFAEHLFKAQRLGADLQVGRDAVAYARFVLHRQD